MNQISVADWTQARKAMLLLEDRWLVIQPSQALRAKAGKLVESYDLRAADAFQLAAALQWCEDTPHERVFLTADDRLLQAATLNGFDAQRV